MRRFLDEHWTADDRARVPDMDGAGMLNIQHADERTTAFRLQAIERGYLYRHVPKRYGGSEQPADPLKAQIIREEFRARGPRWRRSGIGPSMLVPTLLECGTEWQKEQFVPPTLLGEIALVPGLQRARRGQRPRVAPARARELEGDEWVINGQKIWTTSAHQADCMFALCPHRARRAEARGHLVPADRHEARRASRCGRCAR